MKMFRHIISEHLMSDAVRLLVCSRCGPLGVSRDHTAAYATITQHVREHSMGH